MSRKRNCPNINREEALEWKKQYEENIEATIESIAFDNDVSTKSVQKWLKKLNTKMRSPNRPSVAREGSPRNTITDGISGGKIQDIPIIGTGPRYYRGHRRRSKY